MKEISDYVYSLRSNYWAGDSMIRTMRVLADCCDSNGECSASLRHISLVRREHYSVFAAKAINPSIINRHIMRFWSLHKNSGHLASNCFHIDFSTKPRTYKFYIDKIRNYNLVKQIHERNYVKRITAIDTKVYATLLVS